MPPDEHQRQFIKKTRCLRCGQRFNEKHRRIVFVEMDTGQVLWWHGLINSDNIYLSPSTSIIALAY